MGHHVADGEPCRSGQPRVSLKYLCSQSALFLTDWEKSLSMLASGGIAEDPRLPQ